MYRDFLAGYGTLLLGAQSPRSARADRRGVARRRAAVRAGLAATAGRRARGAPLAPGARRPRHRVLHVERLGGGRRRAEAGARGDPPRALRLRRASFPRHHVRRALGHRSSAPPRAVRAALARLRARPLGRRRRGRERAAPARRRRGDPRDDAGRRGLSPAAGRLPRGRRAPVPPLRHLADPRRGAGRPRPHGPDVRLRARGCRTRRAGAGQGPVGRPRAGQRVPHAARDSGSRPTAAWPATKRTPRPSAVERWRARRRWPRCRSSSATSYRRAPRAGGAARPAPARGAGWPSHGARHSRPRASLGHRASDAWAATSARWPSASGWRSA